MHIYVSRHWCRYCFLRVPTGCTRMRFIQVDVGFQRDREQHPAWVLFLEKCSRARLT